MCSSSPLQKDRLKLRRAREAHGVSQPLLPTWAKDTAVCFHEN